jgi:hypothetical protein
MEPFRFTDLPFEIRDRIYAYAILNNPRVFEVKSITPPAEGSDHGHLTFYFHPPLTPILRVRQTYETQNLPGWVLFSQTDSEQSVWFNTAFDVLHFSFEAMESWVDYSTSLASLISRSIPLLQGVKHVGMEWDDRLDFTYHSGESTKRRNKIGFWKAVFHVLRYLTPSIACIHFILPLVRGIWGVSDLVYLRDLKMALFPLHVYTPICSMRRNHLCWRDLRDDFYDAMESIELPESIAPAIVGWSMRRNHPLFSLPGGLWHLA